MYDRNRLGELEKIPLSEFKFLVGGFEVCLLNFNVTFFIFSKGLNYCALMYLSIYIPIYVLMSLYPHQIQFRYKSPASSLVSGPAL